MGHNNDKAYDLLQGYGFSLSASGYLTTSASVPFAYIDMAGFNHFSFTAQCSGSTPTGSFVFEASDIGLAQDVIRLGIATPSSFGPLYQPNTTTQYSLAVSAAGTYNIQIPNLAAHYVRVKWNFTSGSGTLNAWVTCRANGRG